MLKCSGENTENRTIYFCSTKKMLLIQMLAYINVEEKKIENQTRNITARS